ncbi:DNA replication protein [Agrobacterium tumefaciens]|uniref:helix-turn-helix domain-containing protein n=1 Tax=Agrobacterium tumefaciens TaxID=358 RepID=UPI001571B80E|nr:helix-turn-helix domain-containing protein [Agrobacterium tumefaciens]NTE55501.1 DNA replication protein [Agrobacterium tumefaciens]NTE70861.1 DNA replication protein [Agrobacterium tumefaciens]UXT48289.1 DNA replication protein [Agrobacterium tumefaciens]
MPSDILPLPVTARPCVPVADRHFRRFPPAAGREEISRICRLVRQLTAEMLLLTGERPAVRRDRRRSECHIRQIAMYVCHVQLGIPMSDIGPCFGRDRTTVGHACQVVEDRRDEPAFDEFVAALERLAGSIFNVVKGVRDE